MCLLLFALLMYLSYCFSSCVQYFQSFSHSCHVQFSFSSHCWPVVFKRFPTVSHHVPGLLLFPDCQHIILRLCHYDVVLSFLGIFLLSSCGGSCYDAVPLCSCWFHIVFHVMCFLSTRPTDHSTKVFLDCKDKQPGCLSATPLERSAEPLSPKPQ